MAKVIRAKEKRQQETERDSERQREMGKDRERWGKTEKDIKKDMREILIKTKRYRERQRR